MIRDSGLLFWATLYKAAGTYTHHAITLTEQHGVILWRGARVALIM